MDKQQFKELREIYEEIIDETHEKAFYEGFQEGVRRLHETWKAYFESYVQMVEDDDENDPYIIGPPPEPNKMGWGNISSKRHKSYKIQGKDSDGELEQE